MKTKLLCTFTDIDSYLDEVNSIKAYYDIVFNKVFCLCLIASINHFAESNFCFTNNTASFCAFVASFF